MWAEKDGESPGKAPREWATKIEHYHVISIPVESFCNKQLWPQRYRYKTVGKSAYWLYHYFYITAYRAATSLAWSLLSVYKSLHETA